MTSGKNTAFVIHSLAFKKSISSDPLPALSFMENIKRILVLYGDFLPPPVLGVATVVYLPYKKVCIISFLLLTFI